MLLANEGFHPQATELLESRRNVNTRYERIRRQSSKIRSPLLLSFGGGFGRAIQRAALRAEPTYAMLRDTIRGSPSSD